MDSNNLERDYDTLGLQPNATRDDAKQAYRDLAKVWHPDRFAGDERLQQKAQEKLKDINRAYDRVSSRLRSQGPGVNWAAPTPPNGSKEPNDNDGSRKPDNQQATAAEPPGPAETPVSTSPKHVAWKTWIWLVVGGLIIAAAVLTLRLEIEHAPGQVGQTGQTRPFAQSGQAGQTGHPGAAATSPQSPRPSQSADGQKPSAATIAPRPTTLEYLCANAASEADLVRIYGRENLQSRRIDSGMGRSELGTLLFPNDKLRRVEIFWDDLRQKRNAKRIQISGSKSDWTTYQGITLGTSLKELERINGRAFTLTGFRWDYRATDPGTVLSWRSGALDKQLLVNHGRFLIKLDESRLEDAGHAQTTLAQSRLASDNRLIQKVNPRTYEIVWLRSQRGF